MDAYQTGRVTGALDKKMSAQSLFLSLSKIISLINGPIDLAQLDE